MNWWKWIVAGSSVVAAVALVFGQVVSDEKADESQGITDCRALLAFDIQLTTGRLIGALGVAVGPVIDQTIDAPEDLGTIEENTIALLAALEARQVFEANPTEEC